MASEAKPTSNWRNPPCRIKIVAVAGQLWAYGQLIFETHCHEPRINLPQKSTAYLLIGLNWNGTGGHENDLERPPYLIERVYQPRVHIEQSGGRPWICLHLPNKIMQNSTV